MENIVYKFKYEGTPVATKEFGNGHINRSYVVTTDKEKKYVLQHINPEVFHDGPGLMKNAIAVSEHIVKKDGKESSALNFILSNEGEYFARDDDGACWRSYEFVDALCFEHPDTPHDLYKVGVAFGKFQSQLDDYDASSLIETIPKFHDTPNRFSDFKRAVENDKMGRRSSVEEDIAFALERETFGSTLTDMFNRGQIPLRVTHNDTKINNVLFDKTTREPLCIIDLDTVMPGLIAYDVGEAVRTGASTCDEDERDLNKVNFDIEMFRAFIKGFLENCPELSENEKNTLVIGPKMMALENGIRFLGDYLNGDTYFAISYEDQNLCRARAQFKLLEDMEKYEEEMKAAVDEVLNG